MARRARFISLVLAMTCAPALMANALELPPAGASSCGGCHAPVGVGTAVPSLAGRASGDIVTQMQAFRSGAQPSTVMDRIAKGFSDAEIEAIAAWYARQK